jgi:hypothetical protein
MGEPVPKKRSAAFGKSAGATFHVTMNFMSSLRIFAWASVLGRSTAPKMVIRAVCFRALGPARKKRAVRALPDPSQFMRSAARTYLF